MRHTLLSSHVRSRGSPCTAALLGVARQMGHHMRRLRLEVHNGQLRVATSAAAFEQESSSSVEGSKTITMVRRKYFPLLPAAHTHDGSALVSTRNEDITDEVTVTFATMGHTLPQPPSTEFTTHAPSPPQSVPSRYSEYTEGWKKYESGYPPPPPESDTLDDIFATFE